MDGLPGADLIEAGVEDVRSLMESLVEPARLRVLFDEIERELYRFPALDRGACRRAVESALIG